MQLDEISSLSRQAISAIAMAESLESLRHAEIDAVGKKASLTLASQRLAGMSAEDRKVFGAALQEARAAVTNAVIARRSTLADAARRAQLETERLDLTERMASGGNGHVHLITKTIHDLEDIFLGMGFSVFNGPEVETDWYNFEALNFPKAHPARTMHDTFYLELGEAEEVVLRTHTSPMQIRVMQGTKPPIYAVMPGRCYRRDTADARHLPVFHQIEALVIDKGISLGHLAGTIETFIRAYFGKELKARLRPGFFPFTEPSAEFEITCPFCGGDGCKTCSQTGWIELGGCGMVHPNVLKAGGIDSEEYTGFAWGFGIDRLAMNRHDIEDLRMFLDNDARMLRQF